MCDKIKRCAFFPPHQIWHKNYVSKRGAMASPLKGNGRKRRVIIVPKKKNTRKIQISRDDNSETEVKVQVLKNNSSIKHQDNLREILLASNATPIRRFGSTYSCCFCTDNFVSPEDLKEHTLKSHDDNTRGKYLKGTALPNFIARLDITDLKCNICNAAIEDLDDLTQHLQDTHDKTIHSDIKSQIVPFRFGNGLLRCVHCNKETNNYKIMVEHMNVHYSNYICIVCDAGFVNKRVLSAHSLRHKTGVFPCDFCAKIFDTRVKMKEHQRAVHISLNARSKCTYCGEKFKDYAKKNDHEAKVHGVKLILLECRACDRTFDNQRALTIHTKTYHLMERGIKRSS